METLYDILHLAGAICLIVQSIVLSWFILGWRNKLNRMCDSIESLWAEERKRITLKCVKDVVDAGVSPESTLARFPGTVTADDLAWVLKRVPTPPKIKQPTGEKRK